MSNPPALPGDSRSLKIDVIGENSMIGILKLYQNSLLSQR